MLHILLAALLSFISFAYADDKKVLSEISLVGKPGQSARVALGQENQVYVVGVDAQGQFYIRHNEANVVTINKDVVQTKTRTLSAPSVSAEDFSIGGVPQWKLIAMEVFNPPNDTSSKLGADWGAIDGVTCGAFTMLKAGHDVTIRQLSKTFANLGPHTQIRLVATFHFVDDWQGETGFAKIDDFYVFTETHDQSNSAGKLNVCGSDAFPESRFAVPVDVVVPHRENKVKISFGSTLQGSSEAFWGISSVALYVRDQH